MNQFRATGLWNSPSRSQRERMNREYDRVLRIAAGAVPGILSEQVEEFCHLNFRGWKRRVEELQFRLVREVGQFFLANRRLMNLRDAREVYLYHFLERLQQRVKTGCGTVFPKCVDYLNRYVPGWMLDKKEVDTLALLQALVVCRQFEE